MKSYIVTTKRLYVTKHTVEANSNEEAENKVRDLPENELEDLDRWKGQAISMDIESDAVPTETKSADTIIQEITDILIQSDANFIEHIANQILTKKVKFIGSKELIDTFEVEK